MSDVCPDMGGSEQENGRPNLAGPPMRQGVALNDPRLRIQIIPEADPLPLLDCRRSTLGAGEDNEIGRLICATLMSASREIP